MLFVGARLIAVRTHEQEARRFCGAHKLSRLHRQQTILPHDPCNACASRSFLAAAVPQKHARSHNAGDVPVRSAESRTSFPFVLQSAAAPAHMQVPNRRPTLIGLFIVVLLQSFSALGQSKVAVTIEQVSGDNAMAAFHRLDPSGCIITDTFVFASVGEFTIRQEGPQTSKWRVSDFRSLTSAKACF